MFNKPNPKQNFFDLDQQILLFWKENNILEKSIDQRDQDNIKTFYDGPITANGEPHHGHMLTFAMKDIIPRYWTMKGFRVSRSLGWDCQGIPVEYEIEKKLGFKEKKDIEKFGIEKFNELCRESVLEHKGKIIELEELMGRLTNSEEEYATMDAKFIESIWWSLKELYNKGLLYEGFKVVPYSTRAGTILSNAEVALGGYKPFVDLAITVKFELKDEPGVFLLAWTTTPWTIPGNLGLAINKEITYVKVKVSDTQDLCIVAKELVDKVFKDKQYEVIEEVKVESLLGKQYIPPFNFFVGRKNAHKIFNGDFVTIDSGTGIVHLAPYGAEDNDLFQKEGIESFDYLDDQGDFTDMVLPYESLNYREANPKIIEDLKDKKLLFKQEEYEHDMPMCWRTNTPLIYKPITSWYIGVSKLRDQLVNNNEKINWTPKHVKHGRFGNWLSEIKDWGISRHRYWGTPLPVWKSETGKVILIGSFEELEKYSGVKISDPHRPFVDEIEFEFEGEKYKRIPDVIDVWYDSGAMPFARFHYPFENKEKFEKKFPAQYIAESVDQTRGWFYSLHAIATCLFDSPAFENVVMSGFVLDDKGQKLSKSKKNYTAPRPLIEMFGADTIRLNFFSTPISAGEDTTISERTLKIQAQETILPLWNIYYYLTTYANLHNWTPRNELAYNKRNVTSDDHPWDHIPFDDVDDNLDAWLLVRLQNTILEVSNALDNFAIPKATKILKELVDDTSKWYIRRSRDRFSDGDTSAIDTLYYVLIEIIKLFAPIAPFITEAIYQNLVAGRIENAKESIHLTDYPLPDKNFIDQYSNLLTEMDFVRKVCEAGQSLRTMNNLKLRQPLSVLEVVNTNKNISALADWMKKIISEELNVKEVLEKISLTKSDSIVSTKLENLNVEIGLQTHIDESLRKEGLLREFIRNIQAARKNEKLNFGDKIKLELEIKDPFLYELAQKNIETIKDSTDTSTLELIDIIEETSKFQVDDKEIKAKIIRLS